MLILIWTVLGAVIAGLASDLRVRKGRILWMLLGALIGPILALLLYLPMGSLDGRPRTCPACAERVRPKARLCRYCRTALPPPPLRHRSRRVKPPTTEPRRSVSAPISAVPSLRGRHDRHGQASPADPPAVTRYPG